MLCINYTYRELCHIRSLLLHSFLLLLIKWMPGREQPRVRVGAYRSAEQQDEWLGLVNLVVDPTAGLLNSERSPLILSQESLLRHLLEDVLRKQHVAVLVHVVLVLLGILDLLWKVWHISSCCLLTFFEFIYNNEKYSN